MNELIKEYGIDKLNTFTKYPSILTYHEIGEKGCLIDNRINEELYIDDCVLYVTEKIDGTNGRIIIYKNDYIIGSREKLLYAKGDRFADPALNIAETLKETAERLSNEIDDELFHVIYFEVYGGNITRNSKQYTKNNNFSFRMFDHTTMQLNKMNEILSLHIDQISSWRENGGQNFYNLNDLLDFSKKYKIKLVPIVDFWDAYLLPKNIINTLEWINRYSESQVGIDFNGKSEGIIFRAYDRRIIRKVRFEDYERTVKKM